MILTSTKRLFQTIIKSPAAPGILLGIAAILSLIIVNSPLHTPYDALLDTPVAVQIGDFNIYKPLLLWINDGLMAVFFLLVGLEVKREVLTGHLSSKDRFMLPAFAALGGLLVPALVYAGFNYSDPEALNGWAIPAATDIAFAYGVMMLLGDRVPKALKVTLVAIAVIDDIAAVIIIALFYTTNLSYISLIIASLCVIALIVLNRRGQAHLGPYMIIGLILWASVLKSGVHATLAGVVLGLCIPHKIKREGCDETPLLSLEHALHPWVSYGVLPIFAFANAGVSIMGLGLETFTNTITLGIIFGLLFGKQIGVMLFSFIAVKSKLCSLPSTINWKQYYAMSLLTGIGFTMSFFVGTLAFSTADHLQAVRLGVLVGSAASGIAGFILLRKFCLKAKDTPQ